MLPISVTVLTFNSEKHLRNTLDSLRDFNEVIIVDSGSTDSTHEIANQFDNVCIYTHKFLGFGQQHNYALTLCKNNWVLSVDSDEVLSKELIKEIKSLKLENNTIYTIPRKNYFKNQWITGCGWYPDRVKRLFNRSITKFSDDSVHESVIDQKLHLINLKNPLFHFPYSNYRQFLIKMERYSYFFAQQDKGKKKSSPFKAFTHSFFAFFKSYILKRGFMNGFAGLFISLYNAETSWHKYIQLYEANQDSEI